MVRGFHEVVAGAARHFSDRSRGESVWGVDPRSHGGTPEREFKKFRQDFANPFGTVLYLDGISTELLAKPHWGCVHQMRPA